MNNQSLQRYVKLLFVDIICLLLSLIAAYYIRHGSFSLFNIQIYRDILFVCAVIDVVLFFLMDPYDDFYIRGYFSEFNKTLLYDLMSLLLVLAYLFIVKAGNDFSRITLFLTYILYFISSYLLRIIIKKSIRSRTIVGVNEGNQSLLIITKRSQAKETIDKFVKNNYYNHFIAGLCVIDKKDEEYPEYKLIDKGEILDYVAKHWIDDILISCDIKQVPKDIIEGLSLTGIPIHIKINELANLSGKIQIIDQFASFNTITAVNRTYNSFELFLKRAMDIVGGLIGCFVTLILIIIIGPIMYLKSPGPIIYVSDRVGKNGKVFKFYKFRSMVTNADELKKELEDNNRVKDGMMFKIENDPRIIPGIGTFIRKTSLDEFPQFFNVLKGDMSLVGTRPPTVDEWQKYSPYYRSRLSIKPGITGLWQVSGRSEITDFNEVVKLDNEYINNWSIALDIKIILKTVLVVLGKDSGAM